MTALQRDLLLIEACMVDKLHVYNIELSFLNEGL